VRAARGCIITAMALPQNPYRLPSSYTPARHLFGASTAMSSGGGGAMSYQARARELLRRARGGGGAAAMTHGSRSDSLVNMGAEGLATGGTGVAMGMMDSSEYGKAFTKYIHDVAKPSTVAFVLGLGMRAANWDKGSPTLRKANNAMLRTMFPVLGYRLGERLIQGSLFKAFKMKAAAVTAPAKPKTAGAEAPIPGERTTT
jgi:hypothetical protein